MLELLITDAGLSPHVTLLFGLLAGVTSFISAVAGIGGGTVLLGVMSTVIPVTALIPVHGVVQLGSNFFRSVLLSRHAVLHLLVPFVVGSALGSAISGLIFLRLPVWAIQYGIAGFILWSIFGKAPAFGRGYTFVAGGVSGFLTMLFGATGPLIGAFVKTLDLAPPNHVATQASMMTVQHLLKIVLFGFFGFQFAPYLPLILLMLGFGFIGTVLGKSALLKINPLLFKRLVSVVLLVLALRLIYQATALFLA